MSKQNSFYMKDLNQKENKFPLSDNSSLNNRNVPGDRLKPIIKENVVNHPSEQFSFVKTNQFATHFQDMKDNPFYSNNFPYSNFTDNFLGRKTNTEDDRLEFKSNRETNLCINSTFAPNPTFPNNPQQGWFKPPVKHPTLINKYLVCSNLKCICAPNIGFMNSGLDGKTKNSPKTQFIEGSLEEDRYRFYSNARGFRLSSNREIIDDDNSFKLLKENKQVNTFQNNKNSSLIRPNPERKINPFLSRNICPEENSVIDKSSISTCTIVPKSNVIISNYSYQEIQKAIKFLKVTDKIKNKDRLWRTIQKLAEEEAFEADEKHRY